MDILEVRKMKLGKKKETKVSKVIIK